MLRKGLKAIITSVFVVSMLSSSMVCSATETTKALDNNKTTSVTTTVTTNNSKTTTTSVSTKKSTSKKTTKSKKTTTATSESSSSVTTAPTTTSTNTTTTTTKTTTSTSATTTTTPVTTTTESTTTTTVPITTTLENILSETSTIVSTAKVTSSEPMVLAKDVKLNPVEGNSLAELPYKDKLLAIQSNVESYLQNTSATPSDALAVAQKYIRSLSVQNGIYGKDILYLDKLAYKTVNAQQKLINLNKKFYEDLQSTLDNITYKNAVGVESYCNSMIDNAFKNGTLTSKETLELKSTLHDTIMDKFTDWEVDLMQYCNYSFISNQSYVTKWNAYYPDMKGWIYIPSVGIDYPLMQPQVDDNEYYLQYSWDGYGSSYGSIELDYRSSLTDDDDSPNETKNVLIYGHNLSNGQMFSNLIYYKNKSYWEDNQLIEISTEDGQRLYQIYAVCSIYGLVDGTQFKYWDDKYVTMDEDTFNEHLSLTKQTMIYDTGIEPVFGQDILTLQTCDGNNGWRIVVFAKRVK